MKFVSNQYLIPTFDKSIKAFDDINNDENIGYYYDKYIFPSNAVECAMLYFNNSDFIKFVEMVKEFGRNGLENEETPENEIEKIVKLNIFNGYTMYNISQNHIIDIAVYKGLDMLKYLLEFHGGCYSIYCIFIIFITLIYNSISRKSKLY